MASFSWGDMRQAADDAGFTLIPAGVYNAAVKTAEAKKTGTGKDKISVRFNITGGPFDGKSVFNDFVLSPENGTALGFFFRHMKALGLGPEYFATEPSLEKVAADIVGRACQVDVGVRLWNEEERNQVNGIKPLGGPSGAPATAAKGPQPMPTAQPQPAAQPQPQPAPAPAPQPTPAPAPVAETTESAPATEETEAAKDEKPAPPALPF